MNRLRARKSASDQTIAVLIIIIRFAFTEVKLSFKMSEYINGIHLFIFLFTGWKAVKLWSL